jgi:predicted ATPase
MISRIRIQNFLSLKDVTLDLGLFNIFVGPNASGKSAIFKAMLALSRLLRGVYLRAERRGEAREFELLGAGMDQLVWRGDGTLPIVFEVWFDSSSEPDYRLEIRRTGEAWSVASEVLHSQGSSIDTAKAPIEFETQFYGETTKLKPPYPATIASLTYRRYRFDPVARRALEPFWQISEKVGNTWRFRISADDVADPVVPHAPRPGDRLRAPRVDESGYGLAAVLQALQGAKTDVFNEIQTTLSSWFPHIQRVNFERIEPGGVRLAFTSTRSDVLIPASMESDGVLHALVLIWKAFDSTPTDAICVEEPENATHPYRLKERYEFLKHLGTRGMAGFPVRTLAATHSPDFLNAALDDDILANDVLRIVEFSQDEGTRVHALRRTSELETLIKVFKGRLGELWWTGALGGVPKK